MSLQTWDQDSLAPSMVEIAEEDAIAAVTVVTAVTVVAAEAVAEIAVTPDDTTIAAIVMTADMTTEATVVAEDMTGIVTTAEDLAAKLSSWHQLHWQALPWLCQRTVS